MSGPGAHPGGEGSGGFEAGAAPDGLRSGAERLARLIRERLLLEKSFGADPPLRFVPPDEPAGGAKAASRPGATPAGIAPRAARVPSPPSLPSDLSPPPDLSVERIRPDARPAAAPRPSFPGPRPAPAAPPPPLPDASPPPAAAPAAPATGEERARREALLAPLAEEVRACRSCPLGLTRTQAVFGVGDPCARLLFVGEGPGEEEDRRGEPFVGKAGQLLDRMIIAMGLTRQDVYIANIVKCRPPGNRTPDPREMISCFPYLRRQVDIIRPAAICALGNVAAKALLQTQVGITRLHGRFGEYAGIPVLPTFHPAYLLRNPEDKKLAWEDLRKLMEFLGLPLPAGRGEGRKEAGEVD